MKKIVVVGSMNMDFVINVQSMPLKGETVLSEKFELIPGGKGANQAYAIGKLSGQVKMLGAVGNDEHGAALVNNLNAVGVDTSCVKFVDTVNTGNAFITVDHNGDNSIIVVQGSNKYVDKEYIDQNISAIENCDIVVFQLEIPIETVVYAAKKAKALGKLVILDPAPARDDLPKELFESVDVIKPNEIELMSLIGDDSSQLSLRESAQRIVDKGVKNVVVTLGGDGAYLLSNDKENRFLDKSNIKVVDTTAAGDSFTAAMALSFAQGKDIEDAIKFATKVARVVVTRKGAQTSIPTLDEVI